MLFNSFNFLLFFSIVALGYFVLPHRWRWVFLLLASFYFYMGWKAEYVLILILGTTADYLIACGMDRWASHGYRRPLLIIGLLLNIGLLFLFKYWNFFNLTVQRSLSHYHILYGFSAFEWLQPVGISFFTFKKISYLIDVYRRHLPAEKNWGKLALYVSFFPEVASGPISRAGDFLPQPKRQQDFEYSRVAGGLKLIGWGLFKKMVLADRLSVLVDPVFHNPQHYEGISLILATLFYSMQIYADFSAYTDISIGTGQILGFVIPDNFDRPYKARSVGEFWRRWHITLSQWLRDYLFLPITYATMRYFKRDRILTVPIESYSYIFATMATMLLCGLWHGASLHFLVWGGLHGLWMTAAHITLSARKRIRKKLSRIFSQNILKWCQTLVTFCVISIFWIFFKSTDLSSALYILKNLGRGLNQSLWMLHNRVEFGQAVLLGHSGINFIVLIWALAFLFLVHHHEPHNQMRHMLASRTWSVRWAFYLTLVVSIALLSLPAGLGKQFIYLQF